MKHALPTKIVAAFFMLCSLFGAGSSHSQTLDPTFADPEVMRPGAVYQALELSNGKRVFVGDIRRANGQRTNRLVRFNADHTLDAAFNAQVANNEWTPTQVLELAGGKLLALGAYRNFQVDGVSRYPIVRLNADGSLDTGFDVGTGVGPTGVVYCAAVQPDGKILLGGKFTQFNGQSVFAVVRLNTDGSRDASFASISSVNTSSSLQVQAIALQPNGQVLIGINNGLINGVVQKGILRLNSDGTIDASFASGLSNNSDVQALGLQADGKILVIRALSSSSGVTPTNPRTALIRLLSTGAPDPGFALVGSNYYMNSSWPNNEHISIQPDGRIVVASRALALGGVLSATYLARFTTTGQPDPSFTAPQTGTITSVQVLPAGEILVGAFARYIRTSGSAVLTYGALELDAYGTISTTHTYQMLGAGEVQRIALQPDGKILIAGDFTQVGNTAVNGLVRLQANGTLDASFTCQPDGPISTILVLPNAQVFIGGDFTSVNGTTSRGVARLQPNGQPDAGFVSPFPSNAAATSMVLEPGGTLLLQGAFAMPTSGMYQYLVRLTTAGQIVPNLASPFTFNSFITYMTCLAVQPDGRILIGGSISDTGTRYIICRLLADGTPDPSFVLTPVPSLSNSATALALQPDGKILLGGSMTSFGSQSVGGFVRLLPNGTLDPTFAPGTPLPGRGYQIYNLMPLSNTQVLACGIAPWQNGADQYPIAVYDNAGNPNINLNPSRLPDNVVDNVILQPDGLWLLSGLFSKADGQYRSSVARYNMAAVLGASAAKAQPTTDIFPNPAAEVVHLKLDAAARPRQVQLHNALGQVVLAQSVTQAQFDLDVRRLPAGVYLLRVEYAEGPVTRRVVVQ